MDHCEIVEARNIGDADGDPCYRIALSECSYCGNKICEYHSDRCEICNWIFCIPCLISHQNEHSKLPKIHNQSRRRKIA